MSEPKPEYQAKRPRGRPTNGAYPAAVFARITQEQRRHLESSAARAGVSIAELIRSLIDADMGQERSD